MRKYQFMILEDDDIFTELNEKLLEISGLAENHITFDHVQKGLDYIACLIKEEKQLPDVIILDLRMPLLSGFDFLEKLKSFPQEKITSLNVYLLTSSLDDDDIAKAYTYPNVKGFYGKPLSLDKLKEMVKD